MKLVPKFKISRKVLILVAAGILLSGASGAAAVFVGRDAILGPPAETISGAGCTSVSTIRLNQNGQRWLRYYVRAKTETGAVRIRTALRVAGALSNKEDADLYQVVLLDEAGPAVRADMRGRAIGAEVLFARNPAAIPGMTAPFVASYTEGMPSAAGEFYGDRKDLTLDEIKEIVTGMEERDGCTDPVVEGEEGAHGAAASSGHAPDAGEKAGHEAEAAPAESHEVAGGH